MAITPLEQYGTIGRTQDFSIIKQQEDAKAALDQMNLQVSAEKDANDKMSQVRTADNAQMNGKKFDAKEKGDNEYTGDGGRGRKKTAEKRTEGKVLLKKMKSFDMKI